MSCTNLVQCIHSCIAHGMHGQELVNCILMILGAK